MRSSRAVKVGSLIELWSFSAKHIDLQSADWPLVRLLEVAYIGLLDY